MKKLLIIGASGFVGTKLQKFFGDKFIVTGTYTHHYRQGLVELDITNQRAVNELILTEDPDVIIHTAALSDPDVCEQDHHAAEQINFFGTKNIVRACRADTRLVYISTVYVFDGQKGNYREDDLCHPINFYGQTKFQAEQEVLRRKNTIVLRFDILYGYNGPDENSGFFSRIIKGGGLEVNNDQLRQPLMVDDIGRAIVTILDKKESGIFHLAGPDYMTKYELGLALEKLVRQKTELIPVPEKQQIARRPKDVSLNTTKVKDLGITFYSLSEGIQQIKGIY